MATATAPPTPASGDAAPTTAVVKLSLRGETYRVSFPVRELTWRALAAKVHDCYDDARRPAEWTLVYRDDEDDLVSVRNEREFLEAFRVFAELKEPPASASASASRERKVRLHFHVVARVSLKEQLAPVMHAVSEISEKVARLAADTRESLRKSSYVERGRESLYHSAVHTRDALSSAGRGLSQRVRRASTAVVDEIAMLPRRLRTRARASSQDLREATVSRPQTLMATDVARAPDDDDGRDSDANVAELLARARAEAEAAERAAGANQNTVETGAADAQVASTDATPPSPAAAAEDAEPRDEAGHASDAETASTASEGARDDSWDVVDAASPALPRSPFFQVEAADEVEASFTRWAAQLATIRDILPQLDRDHCVDVLDKHNGNLDAALLELTD